MGTRLRALTWITWGVACAAGAAPVPPYLSTTAVQSSAVLMPGNVPGPVVTDCSNQQDDPASASSSCVGAFSTGIVGSGSALAQAAYGILRVGSSADSVSGQGFGLTSASALFVDPVSSNLSGLLHVEIAVDGILSWPISGSDSASALLSLGISTPDRTTIFAYCNRSFGTPAAVSTSCTVEYPIQPGQDLALYAELDTNANVVLAGPQPPSTAVASFMNTAQITRVALLDSAGQPIPNAVIQFGSGTAYPAPEPNPALFLMGGAASLAGVRASRRSQRSRGNGRAGD